MNRILALSITLLLGAPAAAQIGAGEVGLLMNKPSGSAGTVCTSSFSCSFEDTNLARGEAVDLFVRGVFSRPFAVALGPPWGPSSRRCALPSRAFTTR